MALPAVLVVLAATDLITATVQLTAEIDLHKPATWIVFPGEFVHVATSGGWSAPTSSNEAAVKPLGGGWFIAAVPGTSYLFSISKPPPGQYRPTFGWGVTIRVRIPGT